jgi:hypothetical protein
MGIFTFWYQHIRASIQLREEHAGQWLKKITFYIGINIKVNLDIGSEGQTKISFLSRGVGRGKKKNVKK